MVTLSATREELNASAEPQGGMFVFFSSDILLSTYDPLGLQLSRRDAAPGIGL